MSFTATNIFIKTRYFKDVRYFGNSILWTAGINTNSPLYRKLKASDFNDKVFNFTFIPNLESLR